MQKWYLKHIYSLKTHLFALCSAIADVKHVQKKLGQCDILIQ